MSNPIRGRFAPSPSGRMHIGNVFCALLSWLYTKSQGGEMILRIEDLDTVRCREEYVVQLLDDLDYLGLAYDEGPCIGGPHYPYKQSERFELYQKALDYLQSCDMVFLCFCSRDELHASGAPHASDGRILYSGTCRNLSKETITTQTRSPAFRLKSQNKIYTFTDGLYGTQSVNVKEEWGDFILRRSDGLFAYQLAVVVDDAAMGITQIVRGNDLLGSVAPQLQLYDAFHMAAPQYFHIPLLLSEDGRRLSKRDKDLDMKEIRKRYPTPEPLIGKLMYLAGMIDHPFPLSVVEAQSVFDIKNLQPHDRIVPNTLFFK